MTALKTSTATAKGLALVVDDLEANRKILQGLLGLEGYRTITAVNGEQAIQVYSESQPDIIFMDVMMPVMDGYQATARIKELAGTLFVPVIFLTALSESEALVKCIEAGGDDFLSKPFKQEILRAKIHAMQRIRDLSRTVAEQHRKIEKQHQFLLKEQFIAEQIYSRAITGDNLASPHIQSLLRAMSVFSGDLLLTANCPDGRMHILLGDFTGHGLSAAVGVLPTAEVFRAMTAKGFSAPDILAAINFKLNKLLPTGMFMAACFVVIEKDMRSVSVWNAGMPEVLILEALGPGAPESAIKHRVASQYLALGILKQADLEPAPANIAIAEGDRILLCSDGVTEANNAGGEEFGTRRYEQAACATQHSFEAVIAALDNFRKDHPYNDDVSLAEINCMHGLLQGGGNSAAVNDDARQTLAELLPR